MRPSRSILTECKTRILPGAPGDIYRRPVSNTTTECPRCHIPLVEDADACPWCARPMELAGQRISRYTGRALVTLIVIVLVAAIAAPLLVHLLSQ